MSDLNCIKLVHSELTDTIFLARMGKSPDVALDKRKAEADVMAVLVAHMMHGTSNGSEKIISLGDETYTVRVVRGDQTGDRNKEFLSDLEGELERAGFDEDCQLIVNSCLERIAEFKGRPNDH